MSANIVCNWVSDFARVKEGKLTIIKSLSWLRRKHKYIRKDVVEEDEQFLMVETQEKSVWYRISSIMSKTIVALPITAGQSLEILPVDCFVYGRFVENVADCSFALYYFDWTVLGLFEIVILRIG
jgi:hypothetical protein